MDNKRPFHGGKTSAETIENIRSKPLIFPTKSATKTHDIIPNEERDSLIKSLLTRDVDKRICSSNQGRGFEAEIKNHAFMKRIDWDLLAQKKLEPVFKPSVFLEINQSALNFTPDLMIGEMLGGEGEALYYKPRKRKGGRKNSIVGKITSSISSAFGRKGSVTAIPEPKPKTKEELDAEEMEQYWTDYDHECPNQYPFDVPPPRQEAKPKPEKHDSGPCTYY